MVAATAPADAAASEQSWLTVGVTGHRLARLNPAQLPAIADAIAAALHEIAQAVAAQEPLTIRLISALADGADTMVAEAASSRGWSLFAVLPFAKARYLDDFAGDAVSRIGLMTMLDGADAVLTLPDNPSEDPAVAYERAGRVVLGQSDVLLAVWDGEPARGRGGTAQVVSEAIAAGIPVIQIDPAFPNAQRILWDGLAPDDLGQQSVETVARAGLEALPAVFSVILSSPAPLPGTTAQGDEAARWMLKRLGWSIAVAYPALLAISGARRLQRSDFAAPDAASIAADFNLQCEPIIARGGAFGAKLAMVLAPQFADADAAAISSARLFRSGYVTNFLLAAMAVWLTLAGLALPLSVKPLLVLGELLTISAIMLLTRSGNARGWHRRWLDNRHLAECCRCLAINAALGEVGLHRRTSVAENPALAQSLRRVARRLGLPSVAVDTSYLAAARNVLGAMIADQAEYLATEHRQMHRLEHRLHLAGVLFFGTTALVCVAILALECGLQIAGISLSESRLHVLAVAATMACAGLPALGAAIYGIRMQGEFAEAAARAESLGERLRQLGVAVAQDTDCYDTLQRRIVHFTDLMTGDLAQWHRTYRARPLALPG